MNETRIKKYISWLRYLIKIQNLIIDYKASGLKVPDEIWDKASKAKKNIDVFESKFMEEALFKDEN